MALGSSIEWTEATWNPVTGCDKVSPGCKHCYAERMAERLQAMGQPNYRNGFALTLQPEMLRRPRVRPCIEARADLTPAAAMPSSMNGEELRSPDSSS